MSDTDSLPRSTAWQSAVTVLQEAMPPWIPDGAHAMTVVVEFPPGDPGTPPHRHSGPAFGYVLEGEMLFELEGEAPRVIKAGETFWEPGGDVIHYQDGNSTRRRQGSLPCHDAVHAGTTHADARRR